MSGYFSNRFDWSASYVSTFINARKIANIPHFHFRDDSSALYQVKFNPSCVIFVNKIIIIVHCSSIVDSEFHHVSAAKLLHITVTYIQRL